MVSLIRGRFVACKMINTIVLTFLTPLTPRLPIREALRLDSFTTNVTNDVQVALLRPCHLHLHCRCSVWHPCLPFHSNWTPTELAQRSRFNLRLQVSGEQCGGEQTLELYSRSRSYELQVHRQQHDRNPSRLRVQQGGKPNLSRNHRQLTSFPQYSGELLTNGGSSKCPESALFYCPRTGMTNDKKRNNINRSPIPKYFQARTKLGRGNKAKRGDL